MISVTVLFPKKLIWLVSITTAIILGLDFFGAFRNWQLDTRDFLMRMNSYPPSGETIVIAIDDRSIQDPRLGRYQEWRRAPFAEVVNILKEAGVKAIGIDTSFSEASQIENDDDEFAKSLTTAGNVILVTEIQKEQLMTPIQKLFMVARSVGFANINVDKDNIVRSILPIVNQKGNNFAFEAFSFQLARVFLDNEELFDFTPKRQVGQKYFFDDQHEIPLIENRMLVNFTGSPGTIPYLSFIDVLDHNFVDQKGNPLNLKGKIAVIGATAQDLQDVRSVPTSRGILMPGVEIHANIIETILANKWIQPVPTTIQIIFILFLAIVLTKIFSKLKVIWAAILGILLAIIITGGSWLIFQTGWIFDLVVPLILIITLYIVIVARRYMLEEKEKRQLRGAFSRYVAKPIVAEIIKNPEMLKLGGERREMSYFFSDIASFTSISEKLAPEQLVSFLNRYLSAMTDIILSSKGTLDKYEGDAIIAFWGAPLSQPDHALRVCRSALRQLKTLDVLREKWKEEGYPDIDIRIGINTGDAIVGNMGSNERFDYTVIGDSVNLAARLESANKQYGTRLMISEFTWSQIKDYFISRELDLIRVKGKEQPVRVYELLAEKENPFDVSSDANKKEGLDSLPLYQNYQKGLELYKKRKWVEAIKFFEKVLKVVPDDGPARAYINRCQQYEKNPPSANWDGVFEMKTK